MLAAASQIDDWVTVTRDQENMREWVLDNEVALTAMQRAAYYRDGRKPGEPGQVENIAFLTPSRFSLTPPRIPHSVVVAVIDAKVTDTEGIQPVDVAFAAVYIFDHVRRAEHCSHLGTSHSLVNLIGVRAAHRKIAAERPDNKSRREIAYDWNQTTSQQDVASGFANPRKARLAKSRSDSDKQTCDASDRHDEPED